MATLRLMNPDLVKVSQSFPRQRLCDIAGAVYEALEAVEVRPPKRGRIAVAVGSRGIRNLSGIVAETVSWLRSYGAEPFIIPAMGSHGGATAEGQVEVLRRLGVTPEAVGAPVESSMEVAPIPSDESPVRLFMDRQAWDSDGLVLVNRIKPHTSFHGRYESGLVKMLVIGVGKHAAALEMHRFGVRGLRDFLPVAGRALLKTGKCLLGLAVVENAYDETMEIHAVPAEDILEREPSWLDTARIHMPSLPVDDMDVLIVDELGKNISGTGMDPNVIGRLRIAGQPEPALPRIRSLIVTDLSGAAKGSIYGVGLADVITRTLLDKADLTATYENARTSTFLERAKIPYTAETCREAFGVALRHCGGDVSDPPRIVRIKNTLNLEQVYLSTHLVEAARNRVSVVSPETPLFLPDGGMRPF